MAAHVLTPTRPSAAACNECASVSKRRVCHPHVSCGLNPRYLGLHLSLHSHNDDRFSSRSMLPISRRPLVVVRLFDPAIFEASKLKVLFLGDGKYKRPDELPRAYTLTHSDITAKLTLAISQTINKAQIQGWYNRLQRDEVLAEWKKSQGSMSLHVHCHISGDHWLLDTIAKLRFYIFRKELPVVLEAFRYGDENLFNNHPELEEALVWVYFHSNVKEFNRVECWGPLREAMKGASSSDVAKKAIHKAMDQIEEESRSKQPPNNGNWKRPVRCPFPCECCFPPLNIIPLNRSFQDWEDSEQHEVQQAEARIKQSWFYKHE